MAQTKNFVYQDSGSGAARSDTLVSQYELPVVTGEPGLSGTHENSSLSNVSPAPTTVEHLNIAPEGTNAQELAPIDGGLNAWIYCGCGCIAEMFIWGFLYSYGIFQDYYTTHPPYNSASQVAIAAVGTVGLGIQYGEALFLSAWFRRYPDYMRISMWCALALYFVCLFCSSFANKIWHLILLQGVGLGFSGGIMYLPVMILLPQWFSKRRGLAGGIIFAGTGVGGFVFPFILNALLNRVGLAWTLRVWAITTCTTIGIAFLGLRPRVQVLRLRPGQTRPRWIWPQMKYFKTPLFLSFSLTCLIQGLSYFPVSLYIAPFTQQISTPITATIVLSLFNSASVVGQVIFGYLSDRVAYPWIMIFSSLGSALSAFLLWGFAQSPAFIYPFAIVFGSLSGGFSSVWHHASVDCAHRKPENTDIMYAGTAVFKGVSAVIGPILSGILLEAGKSSSFGLAYGRAGFGAVEIFVGSCALATGVGSVAVAVARQRMGS